MFRKPIIVLGAPRSGTTILFRSLSLHPDIWHLPTESHYILEGPFHPRAKHYDSNRVTEQDISDETTAALRKRFYDESMNLNVFMQDPSPLFTGNTPVRRMMNTACLSGMKLLRNVKKPQAIRFLEKTPKNSLRIPLLRTLFPDALYIWITRNPQRNIDSIIAGWHAKEKIGPIVRERYAAAGYKIMDQLALADYSGPKWKFALVPGWRTLRGRTVADAAALQYYQCNKIIMRDLQSVEERNVFKLKYEDFIASPLAMIRAVEDWAELPGSKKVEDFCRNLPRVNDATPHLSKEKMRYPADVIESMRKLPEMNLLLKGIGYESI